MSMLKFYKYHGTGNDFIIIDNRERIFDVKNAEKIVEVIALIDNKELSTGEKRNKLLFLAKGKYIIFIDDDDWIPDYYINELLIAAKSNADCFAINGIHIDRGNRVKWFISKGFDNVNQNKNGEIIYLRKTNHITAVKRELALKHGFPNKSNAEDKDYSDNLNSYLKSEYVIKKPMYEYRESLGIKEYV